MEATITDVHWNIDGTATLVLNGKVKIIIVNPPPEFAACIGVDVFGERDYLLVMGRRWAKAVGRRRMELITTKKGW